VAGAGEEEAETLDLAPASAVTSPEVTALPEVAVCTAPAAGLWRVGKAVDPMRGSRATPEVEHSSRQGNRFDSSEWSTIYMGSTLEACFGETLARYRPKPDLADLVADDWQAFMAPGQVPAEWRESARWSM